MQTNALTGGVKEDRTRRVRFWTYWITAVAAMLVFALLMTAMLMVPGIQPSTKTWMLTVAGGCMAFSLGVGMWRFGSTEAPAMLSPLGTVAGVVLLLGLGYCVINIYLLSFYP
jgi:hypothetical protein